MSPDFKEERFSPERKENKTKGLMMLVHLIHTENMLVEQKSTHNT